MFDEVKKSIQWGQETLTLETGKVARQADGSVIATLGETSVMANVTFAKAPKPGQDFFPLTVHYQEKYYAAGKVPGGFFKREARPSEKETLTARLIDRPIRPLFAPGFKHEVLVMCTVLSHDLVNDPDIVAMIAASAALTISGVPFMGPIGAARVGFANGEYVLNPEVQDMDQLRNNPEQRLDLVIAGTADAVMMVESEAYELTEQEMLGAVKFGHDAIKPVIDAIIELAEHAAKEPFDFQSPDYSALYNRVKSLGEADMRAAYAIRDKSERQDAIAAAKTKVKDALTEEELADANLGSALKKLESGILRGDIISGGARIDGRDTKTVRPIVSQVGILPRTHGSWVTKTTWATWTSRWRVALPASPRCRWTSKGQAAGLRRSRQSPSGHEDGRPGDRCRDRGKAGPVGRWLISAPKDRRGQGICPFRRSARRGVHAAQGQCRDRKTLHAAREDAFRKAGPRRGASGVRSRPWCCRLVRAHVARATHDLRRRRRFT